MRTVYCLLLMALAAAGFSQDGEETKDLVYFLHRLSTVDHLPVLEDSHTFLSSTWDTTGGNSDGDCFKDLRSDANVLLDVDGPGCIHRIFTGITYGFIDWSAHGVVIQVFLDGSATPIYDMEVTKFFDDHTGPFPYPFVFQKTYPGVMFPIPFSRHCRIQLVSRDRRNWGNYWQIVYTKYPAHAKVESLRLPLSEEEKREVEKARGAWLLAESEHPAPPSQWTVARELRVVPGQSGEIAYEGSGVIRELRIAVTPNTAAVLQQTRLQMQWDGRAEKSVDVPLGYFFGNADYQNQKQFSSLLLGINETEAYARFPMPFRGRCVVRFVNGSDETVQKISVKLDIEKRTVVPENWGRFHATWKEIRIDSVAHANYPRFGRSVKPFLVLLDARNCRGKYVGNLLHVAWPYPTWWGEGDWLIWTDESGFPPRYHGTGTEEYYNSGWCWFDRKAVSGFITQKPANVFVYSFHMNDSFQFRENAKVAVEVWWHRDIMRSLYGGTAFWYANPAQEANSDQELLSPRLTHDLKTDTFVWE